MIALTGLITIATVAVVINLYASYKKQDLVWIDNRPAPETHVALTQTRQDIQIPRTIFQNHKRRKIPPNLAKSIRRLQAHAPDFDYIFYDDDDSRAYIQEKYPAALEAYDTLLPGAYKSDLFRIIRLYCDGGVYFDAPFNPHDDDFRLANLFEPADGFVSANDLEQRGMYNAFMASVPNHPVAKTAIDMIIDNVAHRRYGTSTLAITGPSLYHRVFKSLYGEPVRQGVFRDSHGQVRMLEHSTHHIVDTDGNIRYNCRYPTYQLDRYIYWSDTPHYSTLWGSKKVYLPRWYQTAGSTVLWNDGLYAFARHRGVACYKVDDDEWANEQSSDKLYIGCADETFPTDFEPTQVAQFYRRYATLYVQNLDRRQLTKAQSDRTIAVPIGVDLHTLQEGPAWGYSQAVPWYEQEQQLRKVANQAPHLHRRIKKILLTWNVDSKSSARFTSVPGNTVSGYKSRPDLYRELSLNPLSQVSLGRRDKVWRDMSHHAFVYSPIGNGFDCHRTWEALALGCIVIAQPNPTLEEFSAQYPIVFHNNPSQITESDLDRWLVQYDSAKFDRLEMGAFLPEVDAT
jgi:hypothetical protein